MVKALLRHKGDIFPDYSEEVFVKELRAGARIGKTETVSASGRRLFWFDRR